jgi:hypothetical protein
MRDNIVQNVRPYLDEQMMNLLEAACAGNK